MKENVKYSNHNFFKIFLFVKKKRKLFWNKLQENYWKLLGLLGNFE